MKQSLIMILSLPDADEPITREWLEPKGCKPFENSKTVIVVCDYPYRISVWFDRNATKVLVENSTQNPIKTRGELRALCKLLTGENL